MTSPSIALSTVPVILVDAFVVDGKPYTGNPAAVCLLKEELEEQQMQLIARELNLSETAFVRPTEKAGVFTLRWFTPTVEATAHALRTDLLGPEALPTELIFLTASGPLAVKCEGERLAMNFPKGDPHPLQLEDTALRALAAALNLSTVPSRCWHCSRTLKVVVELPSREEVKKVKSDGSLLLAVPFPVPVRGVAVAAVEGHVIVSRYFSPWNGLPEDPVNGSSHTVMAPLWSSLLHVTDLEGQVVSTRGGVLGMTVSQDHVTLKGEARTVLRGQLTVPPPAGN